eukprot:XP_025981737.1 replication factor C subunit 4-like [Glycine max]
MSLSSSSNAYNVPWVEKYHPIKVADAVVNEDAVSRLQVIARNNNMHNLILSGPPRTIKTTSILALMHKLLGGPNCKEAILELNASDERYIFVEKLREMSPLYEIVKEGINIKDIQWLNLSHTSSYFPPSCAEGMAILSFALSLFLIRERGSWRNFALEIASGISKMFAQKNVTLSPGRHKIVILDEADR